MKTIKSILFIAVGLLNLVPVIGVVSADQIARLYGIDVDTTDLEVLMRHRAVMLGLVGMFLMAAAFRPSLQLPAAIAGLVSMASFVLLAFASGNVGPEVSRVANADIVGCIVCAAALFLVVKGQKDSAS